MPVLLSVLFLVWESLTLPSASRGTAGPRLSVTPWIGEEASKLCSDFSVVDHSATDPLEALKSSVETTSRTVADGSGNLSHRAPQSLPQLDDGLYMYGPLTETDDRTRRKKDLIIQELQCRLAEAIRENVLLRKELEAAYWCLGPLVDVALVWRWVVVVLSYWFVWPLLFCCCCCCFYCVDQFEWITRR